MIDSLWTFFVAVAILGPFALPLLWRNPRFQAKTKILASIGVILWTYFLVSGFGKILQWEMKKLAEFQQLSQ